MTPASASGAAPSRSPAPSRPRSGAATTMSASTSPDSAMSRPRAACRPGGRQRRGRRGSTPPRRTARPRRGRRRGTPTGRAPRARGPRTRRPRGCRGPRRSRRSPRGARPASPGPPSAPPPPAAPRGSPRARSPPGRRARRPTARPPPARPCVTRRPARPAGPRPAFRATTGVNRQTLRARRAKRRGSPKPSRYSSTTRVRSSRSHHARRSVAETSAAFPRLTKAERPIPLRAQWAKAASPSPPLWDARAMRPSGGDAGAKVASKPAAPAPLHRPRQLGPTRRSPAAWATWSSSCLEGRAGAGPTPRSRTTARPARGRPVARPPGQRPAPRAPGRPRRRDRPARRPGQGGGRPGRPTTAAALRFTGVTRTVDGRAMSDWSTAPPTLPGRATRRPARSTAGLMTGVHRGGGGPREAVDRGLLEPVVDLRQQADDHLARRDLLLHLAAEMAEHLQHARVGRQHQGPERVEPVAPGVVEEPLEEPRPQAEPLPRVGDGQRQLRLALPGPADMRPTATASARSAPASAIRPRPSGPGGAAIAAASSGRSPARATPNRM